MRTVASESESGVCADKKKPPNKAEAVNKIFFIGFTFGLQKDEARK
jgi:hypothetical protein